MTLTVKVFSEVMYLCGGALFLDHVKDLGKPQAT